MSKLFYFLVLAVACLELVSSQTISCYDCDPINFAADCGDPVGNTVRLSPCAADPNIVNGTAVCLSAFVNITGNSSNLTGIYRGCRTLEPAVADYCDLFRQQNQGFNTTIISCEACNTSRCNTVGFREDGSSGANDILVSSVFILIVNALLVLILNGRE